MILRFCLVSLLLLQAEQSSAYAGEPNKRNPELAEMIRHDGDELLEKAAWDEAMIAFNKALQADPQSAPALFERGRAHYFKKENNRAIADFDEVVRLCKDDAAFRSNAFVARAMVRVALGDQGTAIKDLNTAIDLDPKNPRAFSIRGGVWGLRQEWDKSIADLDRALRLNRDDFVAWHNRGIAYRSKGLLDKAIVDFDRAIQCNRGRDKAVFGESSLDRTLLERSGSRPISEPGIFEIGKFGY